jgi:hypothetical protein
LLKFSGIVIYIVLLTIFYAGILITFPGLSAYSYILSNWLSAVYRPLVRGIVTIWGTLYGVSFFLTVYSIIKLIAMLNAVVKTNRQLQINKFQLIAHSLVLASAVIGVSFSSVFFASDTMWIFYVFRTRMYLYLAVIETVGQLLICWICW